MGVSSIQSLSNKKVTLNISFVPVYHAADGLLFLALNYPLTNVRSFHAPMKQQRRGTDLFIRLVSSLSRGPIHTDEGIVIDSMTSR